MEDILLVIQKWYAEQCDGDWEHTYGIKIETIDNPGWNVTIDLPYSTSESIQDIPFTNFEVDDNDWYMLRIQDGQFFAAGDPTKLSFLLTKFKEIVIDRSADLRTTQ